jgi:hypothetical protein
MVPAPVRRVTLPERLVLSCKGGHAGIDERLLREVYAQPVRSTRTSSPNAARQHLSGINLPFVIVADERLHGMIRKYAEYPLLAEEGVPLL